MAVAVLFLFGSVETRAAARPYFPTIGRVLGASTVRVPVVLYHYVRPIPDDDTLGAMLSVSPESFVQQLAYLLGQGYTPVTPRSLLAALRGAEQLPEKPIILTFDDGTEDYMSTVVPILSSYKIPSTVFVIPGLVNTHGYLTWNQLRTLGASPMVTIGGHGLNHVNLPALETGTARRQITITKNLLSMMSGQDIIAFAYPNGSFSPAVVRMVDRAGYGIAFSTVAGVQQSFGSRFTLSRIRAGGSVESLRKALERY